jgi:hypothetical protein
LNVWVTNDYQEEDDGKVEQGEKDDLMQLIRRREKAATLEELQKEAMRKGVKADLLGQVLEIMELRGEIYLSNNKVVPRRTQLINAPCVECNLRDVCHPDGPINPTLCPYLISW